MIGVDEVLEDLQAIVSEFGDGYVYRDATNDDTCVYATADGVPRCIVGHVLVRRGLLHVLWNSQFSTYDNPAADRIDRQPRFFTDAARDVLRQAQLAQDTGGTWGDALIAAKEAARC